MKTITLQVDDEVAGIGATLTDLAKDIKTKASVSQDLGDLMKDLVPVLGQMAALGPDLKAKADNRSYLGMALEQVVDAFMFTPVAP